MKLGGWLETAVPFLLWRDNIRVMRDMAMRVLAAIAGVPQMLGQLGWNAATNKLAVADTLTAFRDLAYNNMTIQALGSGTNNVAANADVVVVSNAAAAATVRLPLPSAANIGRTVTIKRGDASVSTGTLSVTTVSGTLKVENTTGALVTTTTIATANPRYGTWMSNGAVWLKIG